MAEKVSVIEMNDDQKSAPKGHSRRQFLRTAAIAGGAGLLTAACPAQPPQTVTVEVPAEQMVLRMWTTRFFNPNINLHLNEEAQNAGRAIGFAVDVQAIPGSFQEFAAKLSAAAEAGTLPDIFSPQIATQTFMRDGRMLPIQEVWDEVGEGLGGWHPTAERNFTLDGVGYCLDIGFAPAFMHIREDLVEEAGFSLPFSDLEEMLAFGLAYTNADENLYGLGFAYGLPDDLMHLQPLMWAFGGAAFNEEGDITLDSPENIEALQWYTDLYTVHEVVPPAAVNWEGGGNNQGYLTGQIAMAMNPGSILAAVRRGDTPIEDLLDKTYVAPWPQRTPEVGPQTQTEAGQAFGINKESQFPDEAQDVLRHLWSPDIYIKMMQMGQSYLFPALMGAYEDPYFSEDRWNKQVVENVVPIMRDESWPATPAPWTSLWGTWAGKATSRVILDGLSAAEAMKEAHDIVAQAREDFLGG